MPTLHWPILVLALSTAAVTTLIGYWVSRKEGELNPQAFGFMVAVGAGLLLSLAFFELLPLTYQARGPWTPLWMVMGFLIVGFSDWATKKWVHRNIRVFPDRSESSKPGPAFFGLMPVRKRPEVPMLSQAAACSSVVCITLCAFFDGFEMGVGFSINPELGWSMSLGLLLHVVPSGALATTLGCAGGLSLRLRPWIGMIIGMALLVGASMSWLSQLLPVLEGVILPMATGVLLFVGLRHLLPLAIKTRLGIVGLGIGLAFSIAL